MRFVVSDVQGDQRLDRLLAQAGAVSRRQARQWIVTGRVRVNGRSMRILARPIAAGASVELRTDDVPPLDAAPAPLRAARRERSVRHLPVEVLYLNRHIVAVVKPAGLLAEHDRFGSPSLESIVPGLLGARGARGPLWLVHRLDAGTSGVMVMARTPRAAAALSEAFRAAQAHKTYLALCAGAPPATALIEAPIGRLRGTRHGVTPGGKAAQSEVLRLAQGPHAALVQVRPRTGRTHQIRVHLTHLGHPLLGDALYGGPRVVPDGHVMHCVDRVMLHAAVLRLPHPKEARWLTFSAPPPADFSAVARAVQVAPTWPCQGLDRSVG